jgi:EpsI family protein
MDHIRTRLSVLILLFVLTTVGVLATSRRHANQTRQPNWNAVPYALGEWAGTDGRFDPVYGTDPADSSLLRIYTAAGRAPVIAYVGFFGNLAAITEVHTPELCYPAQGWTILSSSQTMAETFHGEPIAARTIVVEKGSDRRLVTWWYNAGGRPFENRVRYVYAMLALSTFTGRTDGSMVRLETPVDASGAADTTTDAFRRSLLPVLEKALPN